MRFSYANELFIEHPDWSTDAIIKACGMSRTSFYASFVQRFGVKPEEFRKSILKGNGSNKHITD